MKLSSSNVIKRFNDIVLAHPERIAIDSEQREISYKQLAKNVEHVAGTLLQQGVAAHDIVFVKQARSPDFIISILAILKVGATYLPVSNKLSHSELQFMIAETQAKYLITDSDECSDLSNIDVLNFDLLSNSPICSEPNWPQRSKEDCSYVMYTSGSTGAPKGVKIPDRAILRLVVDADFVNIVPQDAIYMTADISFDAATFEIWGALLNGARLIIDGPEFNPTKFIRNLGAKKATLAWLTSGLFHMIGADKPFIFKGLRALLAGGDVLSSSVINAVIKACPELKIINGYGPTENTTFTCCYEMDINNLPSDNVPIGNPIKGTHVAILNDQLAPVGEEEVGILYALGEGVALGYLGERDSKGAFFYNAQIGEGLIYRTGDKVLRKNGVIHFVGREDNLVKIRGYRVSLEFVTEKLYQLPYIENALVYLKKDLIGSNALAVLVTVNSPVKVQDIKKDLSILLSKYMLPDYIEVKESLTLNKNGKISKKEIMEV